MVDRDISEVLTEKSQELKKMFKDIEANLEQWKFSVEDTKEGTRVELTAKALIKKKEKKA
jgi:flagellar motor protein MotB